MQWHQGDFIALAEEKELSILVFSANRTVSNGRLVMGAGAALSVKNKFPLIDRSFGRRINYLQRAENLIGDYYIQSTDLANGLEFIGKENKSSITSVIALQVKRNWRDYANWDLTVESLTQLRDYLEELRVSGKAYRAVLNCPLIGLGGFSNKEKEVKEMVEQILKDTDIFVCTL